MRVSKSGFTALAALTSVLFQACTLPGDNPTPYLTSATPNLIYAGSPATVITLDGAAFLPSSQGRWEGSNRVTTYINSNQITVELTAADVALGAKTRPLVVENPPPGGGTAAISITIGYPKPHITQVSPASGSKAAGSFMITITGTGFGFCRRRKSTTLVSPRAILGQPSYVPPSIHRISPSARIGSKSQRRDPAAVRTRRKSRSIRRRIRRSPPLT